MAPKPPTTINNGSTLVLPLTLPASTTLSPPQEAAKHYIYLQPDSPRDPTPDTPRSLFVANVPATATEASLRRLFKNLGPEAGVVERVDFTDDPDAQAGRRVLRELGLEVGSEVVIRGTRMTAQAQQQQQVESKKRKRGEAGDQSAELAEAAAAMMLPAVWQRRVWKSGGSAVVVFVDRASMAAALRAVKGLLKRGEGVEWPGDDDERDPLGEKRYRTHHSQTYPSPSTLTAAVTSYLSAFTALESQRSSHLRAATTAPDADGFTVVSRGGSSKAGAAKVEDALAAQERLRERDKKRVGGDFYRFQRREGNKRRERELRERFEEDRRRVVELRERRGVVRPEV